MVEASRGRIKPVVVGTAPCKEVILKGDAVDVCWRRGGRTVDEVAPVSLNA
jgi:hypothetical protein